MLTLGVIKVNYLISTGVEGGGWGLQRWTCVIFTALMQEMTSAWARVQEQEQQQHDVQSLVIVDLFTMSSGHLLPCLCAPLFMDDKELVLIFPAFQVTLPEHTPPGSAVITVTATDRDTGDNGKITYRVMSSTQDGFYIDPNNGRTFFLWSLPL